MKVYLKTYSNVIYQYTAQKEYAGTFRWYKVKFLSLLGENDPFEQVKIPRFQLLPFIPAISAPVQD